MSPLADLLPMLHQVLVAGFLAVTALLLLVTVANRFRMRNVLLSWRFGRFFAFPVAPAAFHVVAEQLVQQARAAGRRGGALQPRRPVADLDAAAPRTDGRTPAGGRKRAVRPPRGPGADLRPLGPADQHDQGQNEGGLDAKTGAAHDFFSYRITTAPGLWDST